MDYPKDQKLFDFNSGVWNGCITNPRTLEPWDLSWDLSCCWGAQLDRFGVVCKSQDIRVDKLWYSCFSCDIWIFELWCNVKDQKMLSRCSPLARFALETMLLQRTVKMPQRLSNSTSWNMEKKHLHNSKHSDVLLVLDEIGNNMLWTFKLYKITIILVCECFWPVNL